jgi:hypothetical protein
LEPSASAPAQGMASKHLTSQQKQLSKRRWFPQNRLF